MITTRRRTVGLLVTETGSPYQISMISALATVCAARDVNLIVFSNVHLTPEGGLDAPWLFGAKLAGPQTLDALIVSSLGNSMPPGETAQFLERFRPLPLCTVSMSSEGIPNVQADNSLGIRSVVEHLVQAHGRRCFLFLSRPPAHVEGRVRRQAYADALAEHGLVPEPDIVVPGDAALDPAIIRRESARIATVDAIVAVDDYVVPSLLQVLGELKRRIPEDVSVTGFDDSDIARGSQPALTSVRQMFYTTMEAALDLVLDQVDGKTVPAQTFVPPELVTRRSCGCPYDQVEDVHLDLDAGLRPDFAARFVALRPIIAHAWVGVQGLRLDPGTWEEPLLEAFKSELYHDTHDFSTLLNRCIEQNRERGGEPHVWHHVTSILRRSVAPLLMGDPMLSSRAETIYQQSRVQAGRAETGHAHARRLRMELLAREQALVAARLLRNLDLDDLPGRLPELLSQLEVRTFWFSMYADIRAPLQGARLVSGLLEGQRLALAADAAPFDPRLLVPEECWPQERFSWVVHPIHEEERQLGLLVCRYFKDHSVVFDLMATQLGAALQGAHLIRRVNAETEKRERAERERLERELQIAQRIQTSILPHDLRVPGLDIAAAMVPATEVGGDYYDVLPMADGCYLGIGDVAGHGLDTGLVMMMLQSAVAAVLAMAPDATPRQVLQAVNKVLYQNIRERLHQDQHVTLTLLRYATTGHVSYAGAHEDPLVYRARTGRVETIPVSGTWVAAVADIAKHTNDEHLLLEPGDVLLLYTDGSIEAQNARNERFGIERLVQELERMGREPVAVIRDHLLRVTREWLDVQLDDIAFVVARHTGSKAE